MESRTVTGLKTQYYSLQDRLADWGSSIRPYLPPVNLITMHHAYFILVGLLFTVIFWAASHPSRSVGFMDSLFLVESAFTSSGLNTVNLSQLTVGQQVILALMMVLGSPVLISLFTIWFRTHIFEKRFEDIVEMERNRRFQTTGAIMGMTGSMFGAPVMSAFAKGRGRNRLRGPLVAAAAAAPPPPLSPLASSGAPLPRANTLIHTQRAEEDALQLGVTREKPPAAAAAATTTTVDQTDQQDNANNNTKNNTNDQLESIQESKLLTVDDPHNAYLPQSAYSHGTTRRRPMSRNSGRPGTGGGGGGGGAGPLGPNDFDFRTFIRAKKKSIGRNGQFFDLTDEEREYLGGVEYRSLRILFAIVAFYFVVFQVLGCFALGAWMASNSAARAAAGLNEQNPWWTGVFLAVSSFNNAGMTLLDAGIAAYANDAFVLTIVTVLALAGNYAFAAFLRAAVFLTSCVLQYATKADEYTAWKEAFEFILKYPRRLYMMMFPARANWIFVAICSSLGVVNWIAILVLNIGNSVLDAFPVGQRVGLSLFQSLTIPSGGYTVVSASGLYFDVLVLWVIMMYVSAYPEIIVMRNSNVYEERSLGIYVSKEDDPDSSDSDQTSLEQLLCSPRSGDLDFDSRRASLTLSRPLSLSEVSQAATHLSARSIRKLAAVGRRGTAFLGKQIQRRVNNFQGVGVAVPAPPPPTTTVPTNNNRPHLRRAQVISFDDADDRERKLGAVAAEQGGQVSLVTQHLRSQLSHDIWCIALALFAITIVETRHTLQDPQTYSVFNFLFEIVSGYTNIGLSLGVPDASFSFSGGWYTGSKFIMVVMMVRGRHRGLPVALDHAVKLPGWDNARKQQEDAEIRQSMSRSRGGFDDGVNV